MKLSNGSVIKVDLEKITIKEWRFMWNVKTDDLISDEIFGRCVGMSLEEIEALSMRDYQRVASAIRKAAGLPIPDDDQKNSVSEST
jgi:hypothetical protein